jgi:hypothetical protein
MEKKYNDWNENKINIELNTNSNTFINVREIWFTKM